MNIFKVTIFFSNGYDEIQYNNIKGLPFFVKISTKLSISSFEAIPTDAIIGSFVLPLHEPILN